MLGARAPGVGTGKTGSEAEKKGKARMAAAAVVQTKCRAAADPRRNRKTDKHATPSTAVFLSVRLTSIANHTDSFQFNILLALSFCLLNHFGHAVQLLARELR